MGLKSTWQALRIALHDDKPKMAVLRHELLDCFENEIVASMEPPTGADSGEALMNYWEACLAVQNEAREVLLDWVLTESRIDPDRAVAKCVIPLLERINAVPRSKEDASGPNPAVVDAMAVFGYEMSLYCTACLMEVDSPSALQNLLAHPFSRRDYYRDTLHTCLSEFCHYSRFMNTWNSEQEQNWISPIAHRVFERCTNSILRKDKLIEAEALLFMANVLQGTRWYPYTAVYASSGIKFPWFQKARFTGNLDRLAILTGSESWRAVRDSFVEKFEATVQNARYEVFSRGRANYLELMGMAED